jgi:integrase
MWVEPLENGKFKYCERYKDPLTGKTKRVSVTLLKDNKMTRKDAAAILQKKIAEAYEPSLKNENLTLRELCDLYIESLKHTVVAGTVKRNMHAVNTICRYLNPAALVKNLTAGYVSSHLFAANEKPGTKNERLVRFKSLMHWAYQNDYIGDVRWLDKLQPLNDKEKKEKLEHKFLEKDELAALLDAMNVTHWRQITQFMALSGARVGEVFALTVSDVDFTNKTINFDKTMDLQIKNDVHAPKTSCSNREITMQPELEELCKEVKHDLNAKRLKYGTHTKVFFSDINGDYCSYYAFNKYLGKVSKDVLGRKITTHVLRHTHVSLLAEAGVPLETITRRVGHEDSRITKKIYLHVTERMKERDRQLINGVNLLA